MMIVMASIMIMLRDDISNTNNIISNDNVNNINMIIVKIHDEW